MKRRSKLFIILLLVLTAAVIVYALFFMGRSVETSEVSLPTSGPSGGVLDPDEPDYTELELTPSNVQAALAELHRAESYSCTVTIDDYWESGSSSTDLQVWVSGENTLIRSQIGGGTRNVLVSEGMLYIWNDSISGVYAEPYESGADAWMRSITYEDLLDLDSSNIHAAGYQKHNGADCIFCSYIDPETGYENIVYVDVSTGLLVGAESYDTGKLFYRMTASGIELSAPDESLFVPPDA